ncbi:MAG: class II fructose-bisphosphate aldolase family protein [Oscillospiraceae bacterium]|nr:class II fructose-bisphosphate aldolase family protein [Oscillospiraceae bacterium]
MPYSTTAEMLKKAQDKNYAICAFNAENLEMAQAIATGAIELCAPVIIQTTPSTVKYAGLEYFCAIAKTAAKNSQVQIALHLDHGDSFELAQSAIEAGYSSVMIDASYKPFEENIQTTKKVVEFAKSKNIPVEAELGTIGGKEDSTKSAESLCTDPAEAEIFIAQTRANSLAVAIGTAHGIYKSMPNLDLDRLSEIKEALKKHKTPLVLHGATGIPNETIKECVRRGINKINFATELRLAYTSAVRQMLASDENMIDVKIYSGYARERIKTLVKEKIELSGSAGKG